LTKAVILKELDLLKVQIQLINQKLDRNLKELEKTHEKHNQLKKPISTEIKTYKETITEEVNCSCSNQCTVF
jgi:peptidoglycan hydrolase CwlO-like protein